MNKPTVVGTVKLPRCSKERSCKYGDDCALCSGGVSGPFLDMSVANTVTGSRGSKMFLTAEIICSYFTDKRGD